MLYPVLLVIAVVGLVIIIKKRKNKK